MKYQEMNLNISYDLPKETWERVIPEIYKEMDGWIGYGKEELKWRKNLPHWFSFNENEKHICASVEPSGLQFSGLMENAEWEDWKKKITIIATKKLGFKVDEIE
ncbi:MAG: hypothetical protein AAF960_13225 [Bacteroidota bacterium]